MTSGFFCETANYSEEGFEKILPETFAVAVLRNINSSARIFLNVFAVIILSTGILIKSWVSLSFYPTYRLVYSEVQNLGLHDTTGIFCHCHNIGTAL